MLKRPLIGLVIFALLLSIPAIAHISWWTLSFDDDNGDCMDAVLVSAAPAILWDGPIQKMLRPPPPRLLPVIEARRYRPPK
jgi:hypothetical protein